MDMILSFLAKPLDKHGTTLVQIPHSINRNGDLTVQGVLNPGCDLIQFIVQQEWGFTVHGVLNPSCDLIQSIVQQERGFTIQGVTL